MVICSAGPLWPGFWALLDPASPRRAIDPLKLRGKCRQQPDLFVAAAAENSNSNKSNEVLIHGARMLWNRTKITWPQVFGPRSLWGVAENNEPLGFLHWAH